MARPSTAARRYAEAVFELARRDSTEDAWAIALGASARALGSDEVLHIVENPAIPFEARRKAVAAAIGRADEAATDPVSVQLANLADLLLQRRRIALLPVIAAEYERLFDRSRGIVAARVTSAARLDEADETALRRRVEGMTGATVRLASVVDPSLIGGLTLQVGDRLLDASVRGRLERLRFQLVAGSRGTTRAG
ncbi:MAG TPA: F0F1 ATP synthase subunit delta [Candidatus Limnocylindrales bacterium]|nr:F0F1 ATP synthase subunit delta [Candidatus Limnocylindrales bacterium]